MGFLAAATAFLLLYAIWSRLRSARAMPSGIRNLLLLRGHYVLIGLLLGPLIPETVAPLLRAGQDPLLDMMTGWMGLALGIELDLRRLRKMSFNVLSVDMFQALFTLVSVYLLVRALLPHLPAGTFFADLSNTETVMILAVSAATTATWSQTVLAKREWTGPAANLLRQSSAFGNAAGIFTLAIAAAFTEQGRFVGGGWARLGGSIGLGAVMGILVDFLSRERRGVHRIGYATFGVMAFGSGLCAIFRFPAIFVGMVSGAWLINSTLRRMEVLTVVEAIRPSVAGIFLMLIGLKAGQDIQSTYLGLIVPALLGCVILSLTRGAGKILGTNAATRLFSGDLVRGRSTLGMGLLTQETTALAVLAEGLDAFSPQGRFGIVLTAGLMMVLMQTIGPSGATFALVRAQARPRAASTGSGKNHR